MLDFSALHADLFDELVVRFAQGQFLVAADEGHVVDGKIEAVAISVND